jgi:hypothetical protein
MMPNIFYDLSKIDFEHITLSDTFVYKKDGSTHDAQYYLARARYNKNVMWGIVSPNLKIIDIDELPNNYIDVTFSLPTDDPTFANLITNLEEKCINHVYIHSSQIYGKNKSLPIIYMNHISSLKAQPVEFKIKLNLNQDGTSFWTVGGNQRMQQPTFDTLIKYTGRVSVLFKLNGVAINKDGKFNAEWKVEQVLFKDMIDVDDGKCLLRKRKVLRQRRKAMKNNEEQYPDISWSEPDLDPDHLKEIPDKIVENEFKKRLFLTFS